MTAAKKNNVYLDKDAARDSGSADEREIKRGASGCQVDQNKHWVPCRQRAYFSQTDTKLDPLLSGSKQHNTNTTSSVNVVGCLCEKYGFLSVLLWSLTANPVPFFDFFLPFLPLLLLYFNPPSLFLLGVCHSNPIFVQSVRPASHPSIALTPSPIPLIYY